MQSLLWGRNSSFQPGSTWRGRAPEWDTQLPWPCPGHPWHWHLSPLCITPIFFPGPSISLHLAATSTRAGHTLWQKSFSFLCQGWRAPWPQVKEVFQPPEDFCSFSSSSLCASTGPVRGWQQSCCVVPGIAFPMPCEGSRSLLTLCCSPFYKPSVRQIYRMTLKLPWMMLCETEPLMLEYAFSRLSGVDLWMAFQIQQLDWGYLMVPRVWQP